MTRSPNPVIGECACEIVDRDPLSWVPDSLCPTHGDDVHLWFELTRANYAVLHRTVLQSMPREWQVRFVAIMREVDDAVVKAKVPVPPSYTVQVRGDDGRFRADPIPHYRRGHVDGLSCETCHGDGVRLADDGEQSCDACGGTGWPS